LCASNTAGFTDLFCSPHNRKSTFDYYAFFGATAKGDLASVLTRQEKRNRERLLRLQWREELDAAYTA
jgi:hypothetical protein